YVEHAHRLARFCEAQRLPEFYRLRVTHRDDILHQHRKKFRPLRFLVHRVWRPSGFHNVTQVQPIGQKVSADHGIKSGQCAWLAANEKRSAFRRERISSFSILLEQVETGERIRDDTQSALGGACFLAELLDWFR